MQRIPYRSKKTGEAKVFEYPPRDYHAPATERARALLRKRPFKRVIGKNGGGWRWSAGQRGPVFNDATVTALIAEGFAVCVGDFVEMKGAVR